MFWGGKCISEYSVLAVFKSSWWTPSRNSGNHLAFSGGGLSLVSSPPSNRQQPNPCNLWHMLWAWWLRGTSLGTANTKLCSCPLQVQSLDETLQNTNLQVSHLKSDLRVAQQEKETLEQEVMSLHKQLQNANEKVTGFKGLKFGQLHLSNLKIQIRNLIAASCCSSVACHCSPLYFLGG